LSRRIVIGNLFGPDYSWVFASEWIGPELAINEESRAFTRKEGT
jgi:hypothetical protein